MSRFSHAMVARRSLLKGVALSCICASLPARSLAAEARIVSSLPRRSNFVIRNAQILTIDPNLGDFMRGSIHVQDGSIIAVGDVVEAPGATVIDGRGTIVMPGLIDTHYHMWQTLFRSFGGSISIDLLGSFGSAMLPEDMYAATLLAGAEAINAGITTVHDWCHNIPSREYAEQDLRALGELGIRALWSFGQKEGQSPDETILLEELAKFDADWRKYSANGLLQLGMAWRGMYQGGEFIPELVYRKEFEVARELGLPITTHTGTFATSKGHIKMHFENGLLGPDVNIVHATSASPEEVDMIRRSGTSVSVLPLTELVGGFGLPKLTEFMAEGIPVGLGLDTAVLGGSANMFKVMQFAMGAANSGQGRDSALPPKLAVELATLRAAKVLGIDSSVGSLTPGKRADLIMLRTDTLSIGVEGDPYAQVVACGAPDLVDLVSIDGRLLKMAGSMTSLDPAGVARQAMASSLQARTRMSHT
jgi:5-methylthioadenosine/S-adenosylhomocysteine deaminase